MHSRRNALERGWNMCLERVPHKKLRKNMQRGKKNKERKKKVKRRERKKEKKEKRRKRSDNINLIILKCCKLFFLNLLVLLA